MRGKPSNSKVRRTNDKSSAAEKLLFIIELVRQIASQLSFVADAHEFRFPQLFESLDDPPRRDFQLPLQNWPLIRRRALLEGRAFMKTMGDIDPKELPESFKLAINELCLKRETNVEN